MKVLKSLDLKSASPDSRLCNAIYLFLSSGAVMTACHLAVTLQLHSPAFAELQSCIVAITQVTTSFGCLAAAGGMASPMWCAVADLERNKFLSQDCRYIQIVWLMEGTVICVTWTWWLVAASALIITLVGHYYQIAIMTGCGCPPSWWPWWPWPTSTAAGTWSCARHWGTNTS